MELAFFAITLTSGGTPRGAECEGLKRVNDQLGLRSLFIFNGIVGIITSYQKQRGHHGYADVILRSPAVPLSRLLLVLWGVIFPTMGTILAARGLVKEADNYARYLYVRRGRYMNGDDFSDALRTWTDELFCLQMGLRDLRQFLDAFLKEKIGTNFGDYDAYVASQGQLDGQTGHTTSTSNMRYGVDHGAHQSIPQVLIHQHQRVSCMTHLVLGLQPPSVSDTSLKLASPSLSCLAELTDLFSANDND